MTRFGQRTRTGTAISEWGFPTGDGPVPPTAVDYLVVAGGGSSTGGGTLGHGGGGGGGVRSTVTATGAGGALESALSVTPGATITITVGSSGQNSVLAGTSTITSTAGGAGGTYEGGGGSSGGSGGGGAGSTSSAGGGGSGTANQGNSGGSGSVSASWPSGGGGGGAAGSGGAGSSGNDGGTGGTGGAGVAIDISGSSVYYGAGHGGASWTNARGTNGTGWANTANTGHATQSGVVILRYADTFGFAVSTTGSPTVTTTGGYKIYTFTGSGTIVF